VDIIMAEVSNNTVSTHQSVSRVGEMVLAIIGGIFGLIGGISALAIGGMATALKSDGGAGVTIGGGSAIAFSALALVAAFFVSSKSKLAGWLLLAGAFGGIISISAFYILPFILLLIAGLMCLLRGRK
jgi:hypothetical protein